MASLLKAYDELHIGLSDVDIRVILGFTSIGMCKAGCKLVQRQGDPLRFSSTLQSSGDSSLERKACRTGQAQRGDTELMAFLHRCLPPAFRGPSWVPGLTQLRHEPTALTQSLSSYSE